MGKLNEMKIIFWSSVYLSAALLVEAGTVSGQIKLPDKHQGKRIAIEKYTGKISGKVAKPPLPVAGVWLTRRGLTAPKSSKRFILNQKNYQFGKSLMVIPKGATVFFPNEDIDYHNIFSLSKTRRFDLGRYRKNETPIPSVVFNKAGLVELRCEIHEHMQAKLLVVDSPYYTITDASGSFKLTQVPAGTYTLHAQLSKKQKWSKPIQVKAQGTTNVQL